VVFIQKFRFQPLVGGARDFFCDLSIDPLIDKIDTGELKRGGTTTVLQRFKTKAEALEQLEVWRKQINGVE